MAVGNGRLLGVFAAEDSKFRRVKILAREWGGLLAEAVFRVFGFTLVPCLVTPEACLRFTLGEGRATIVLQQLESITQDPKFLGGTLRFNNCRCTTTPCKDKGLIRLQNFRSDQN